ncbi:MAG: MFS transporter [Candidatus Omnitrophica bacterium]|nr:MFS transporter [Candidatus Omnitrophota bacterium]
MDKRSFSILCLLFLTLSFSVAATAPLIPAIADYFGQSAIATGKLIWAYMIPYGLCALFWGPLTRKFSVKRLLLVALSLFSLSAFTISTAPTLQAAFWGRFGMGVFGSCFVPISLIIVGKEIKTKKKPKYVGILFSLSFLSGLIGTFCSGFLFWRAVYFIPFFVGTVTVGLAAYWLKAYNYTSSFKITYFQTLKNKEILHLFGFIFMASFFYHGVQQWLGVFLAKGYLFNQFLISLVFTISSLVAIFSESFGGLLSGRISPLKIASWGLFSMGLFIFLLGLFEPGKAVFFIIVFWGAGWAFNHVGLSTYLTSLPDEFLRDAASLNSALRFIAGGLGAFLGGKIIFVFGFEFHFLIAAVAIVSLGFILRKKEKIISGGR